MDLSTRNAAFDVSLLAEISVGVEDLVGVEAVNTCHEETLAFHIERVSSRGMLRHQTAWLDLASRAMEINVFLEPAFALPLIQHVGRFDGPDFLLVWEQDGPTSFGRLLALIPLAVSSGILHGLYARTSRIVRGFDHPQVPRGTPLLDADRGAEAFDALLVWLRAQEPKRDALLLSGIPLEGVFFTMLMRANGPNTRPVREYKSAVLRRVHGDGARTEASTIACFGSAKRRKEIRRQHRRLSEVGGRRYVSARSIADIVRATERFLALENKGWKGARRTALLADPGLSTFTRSMTRLMAHEGKCRIDSIEINGQVVSMGIIFTIGDRAYFWKTAFDETYANLSPGVQFAIELTEVQLADPSVGLTDSCAIPDHPMIDRVWNGRMAIADLLIDLRPDEPSRFERAYRYQQLAGHIREKAKLTYKRLFGRKRSR